MTPIADILADPRELLDLRVFVAVRWRHLDSSAAGTFTHLHTGDRQYTIEEVWRSIPALRGRTGYPEFVRLYAWRAPKHLLAESELVLEVTRSTMRGLYAPPSTGPWSAARVPPASLELLGEVQRAGVYDGIGKPPGVLSMLAGLMQRKLVRPEGKRRYSSAVELPSGLGDASSLSLVTMPVPPARRSSTLTRVGGA